MDSQKIEYRILIKNLWKIGYSVGLIWDTLKKMLGTGAPTIRTVKKWVKEFRSGETEVVDKPRSGAPRTGRSDRNIRKVSAAVEKDRRFTIQDLSKKTKLSQTTVWRILTVCLGLILKCARWIPKVLTKEQKNFRVAASKENLTLYYQDPEFFENQLVTGDETYIHHYEPETKRQSMQWLESGSAPPKKAIRKLSAKKVMALVFWDNIGVLLIKYFRKGQTMTGAVYAELLQKLRNAIQKKRKGMWRKGVFLLHDNAPSHTSKMSKKAITELGFTEITHPPYSPDLAPSDYFLFPHLKTHLRKKSYKSNDQVENATNYWLTKQPASFFSQGISRLHHRWEKCVKVKGEYVEK